MAVHQHALMVTSVSSQAALILRVHLRVGLSYPQEFLSSGIQPDSL